MTTAPEHRSAAPSLDLADQIFAAWQDDHDEYADFEITDEEDLRHYTRQVQVNRDNLNRQLVQRVHELEDEIRRYGQRAQWALAQDDPGWWEDVLEALIVRGRELTPTTEIEDRS